MDDRNKIMTQITIIPNKGNKMNLPKNGKRLVGGVKRSRVSKDLYQPKRLDTCQVKIDSLFFKFFHLLLLFIYAKMIGKGHCRTDILYQAIDSTICGQAHTTQFSVMLCPLLTP